jgi:hypothetical protein
LCNDLPDVFLKKFCDPFHKTVVLCKQRRRRDERQRHPPKLGLWLIFLPIKHIIALPPDIRKPNVARDVPLPFASTMSSRGVTKLAFQVRYKIAVD